jgi:hypothetical protein
LIHWERPVATTHIVWNWGSNTNIDFHAGTDILDFGWFQADQFTVSEVNGTVVVAIPSNHQTYTLQHTTLHDLHLSKSSPTTRRRSGNGRACSAMRRRWRRHRR